MNLLLNFRLRLACFALFLAGTALWLASLRMEYYTDPARMEEIERQVDFRTKDRERETVAEYLNTRRELETNKRKYMDFGSGLMVAFGSLFLYFLLARIKSVRDLSKIRATSPIWLICWAYILWLSGIFWIAQYMTFRLSRGDFPWFADAVVIPIFEVSFLIVVGCFLLAILFYISLKNSRSRAPLFVRMGRFSFSRFLWASFFNAALFFSLAFTGLTIYYGVHGFILIFLFIDYLFLALRAGKLAEKSDAVVSVENATEPAAEPLGE